ncbi:MAG: tetratricopeptide repeat protein [Candidatus Scalinduaceae bacterium]
MRKNKILIIFIPFFVFPFMGQTLVGEIIRKEAIDIFFEANKEFQAAQKAMSEKKENEAIEKFKHAAQLYEKLLDSNFINGQIYYNLGNAYYRQGMSGKAILYYRRAEKLLPRNADIKANINLLKSDFEDKEAIRQIPEILKVMCFWYFFLNLSEITTLMIYVYLALIATILSIIFLKFQWLGKLSIIFGACLLVLIISLCIKGYKQNSIEKGVVIADECKIRYGPGEEYEPKFEIHEGAEVKIEEEGNKWYKVYVYVDVENINDDEEKKDMEFKKGWIPKGKVEKI